MAAAALFPKKELELSMVSPELPRFDKDMEARLLISALTRLDELPLRLVETTSYGSPWHELASSDVVKQAIKAVPSFAAQVKELAGKAVNAFDSREIKAVTPPDATADKRLRLEDTKGILLICSQSIRRTL